MNGGKLYFYVAGTTTPAAVYTSSAMTTAHAHPVVATTAGLFPAIWLAAGTSYDVTCKNAAGAVQWTTLGYASALTSDEVGRALYPITAAEIAAGVTPSDYAYPPGDVRRYGTNATPGITDMTGALAAAFAVSATHPAIIPNETLLHTALLTVPDYGTVTGGGRNSAIMKGYNGDQISLGRYAVIDRIRLDGNKSSFTGGGIYIGTGTNTTTVANQGHQLIESVQFENHDDYPIEYTADSGFISKVNRCQFHKYDSDAAIKWPDEVNNGSNREVIRCYSDAPIVNVGGADNGRICFNVVGGENSTGQGIVFPSDTTNRPRKIEVSSNRFGIANGTINIRGEQIIFAHNHVAGSVILENNDEDTGALACIYRDNDIIGTFTDSSNATNYVYTDKPTFFTPTWTSTGTAPSFGDATVTCSYTRRANYVRAEYYIFFGSTSTFGSGVYKFSLPVATQVGSADFVGACYAEGYVGVARTIISNGEDAVYVYFENSAMSNSTPVTWASGDRLIMQIEYRIF